MGRTLWHLLLLVLNSLPKCQDKRSLTSDPSPRRSVWHHQVISFVSGDVLIEVYASNRLLALFIRDTETLI
jgi:hypothetical protein